MRKLLLVSTVLSLLFIGCQQEVIAPSEPTDLVASASSDGLRVVLSWNTPLEGEPDGYIIYFKRSGTGDFIAIDSVTVTEYTHDPDGWTGQYYVTAYNKGGESDPSNTVSTIPVHTTGKSVYELNSAYASGFGWDRQTGEADTFPMSDIQSADDVDFYITNFVRGDKETTPYYLASPDVGPTSVDSTVIDPANWRKNGITEISSSTANDTVPPGDGEYANYAELIEDSYYAVHTEDDYYGVVYITNVTPKDGQVTIESWFQLVRGLRLFKK